MQSCQLPGGGLDSLETSEQVQCLRDVVFTFNWRGSLAAPSDDKAAGLFLHLLERYADADIWLSICPEVLRGTRGAESLQILPYGNTFYE